MAEPRRRRLVRRIILALVIALGTPALVLGALWLSDAPKNGFFSGQQR